MENGKDLSNKHQMVAFLAAQGLNPSEIGEAVGLASATISKALSEERMAFEVKQIRYKLFGKDAQKKFRDMLPLAQEATENILTNPNEKSSVKLAAAQEVFDRVLGKPKQTVEHEGSLIRTLFEKLDQAKEVKAIIDVPEPALPPLIDINPNEKTIIDVSSNPNFQKDAVDSWVEANL